MALGKEPADACRIALEETVGLPDAYRSELRAPALTRTAGTAAPPDKRAASVP